MSVEEALRSRVSDDLPNCSRLLSDKVGSNSCARQRGGGQGCVGDELHGDRIKHSGFSASRRRYPLFRWNPCVSDMGCYPISRLSDSGAFPEGQYVEPGQAVPTRPELKMLGRGGSWRAAPSRLPLNCGVIGLQLAGMMTVTVHDWTLRMHSPH